MYFLSLGVRVLTVTFPTGHAQKAVRPRTVQETDHQAAEWVHWNGHGKTDDKNLASSLARL